jgi:4-hydroxythreonine-4-phosphate dehydrogenase
MRSSVSRDLPPIALTCGEPAGIGPELAPKALAAGVPFFLLGDPRHLPDGTDWTAISAPDQVARVRAGSLPVLIHTFPGETRPGQPDPADAVEVVAVIAKAVSLVQAGQASAVCTLPIHKKALQSGAGFAFPGHTEYLAALAGVPRVVMMLACHELRVVPVTIHIALDQVATQLTEDLLEDTIRITATALEQDFGLENPKLAIAGLNPHAGEGGAMGTDEPRVILPVMERLRAEGFALTGPHPADTMFHAAARARYDAAICMYHDQALIPIKTIDFAGGVNVTLGLPFIRTSPDHGTAFDIAGKGLADPTSTIAALRMAAQLATRRRAGA